MKYLLLIALNTLILSSCSTVMSFMTGIPSSSDGMDSAWSEICRYEIVANFNVTYRNGERRTREIVRRCSNRMTTLITPNEEEEHRAEVFEIFDDICMSRLLISGRLKIRGPTYGTEFRNCSR